MYDVVIARLGAFGFGLLIGWYVYYINRYRKGDVQFSDLTTLIGVIGGGGITALFGASSGALFGAYGIGLAVGLSKERVRQLQASAILKLRSALTAESGSSRSPHTRESR